MSDVVNGNSQSATKKWKRPENVPFPMVWLEFEGRPQNGKARKYWIQDITPEWIEPALYWLEHGLFLEEPIFKYSGVADKADIQCARNLWRKFMDDRLGLICLTRDDDGKVVMAGLNYLCRSSIDDEQNVEVSSPMVQKILDILDVVYGNKCPYKALGITECLAAVGLFVLPEFRGESLGLQILKAREPLSRAMGLKATITVFTSFISQKLATRCGFKDLFEMDYVEFNAKYPHLKLDNITEHTKSIKSMYWEFK